MEFPDEIPQDEMSICEKQWRIAGYDVMAVPGARHIIEKRKMTLSYKLKNGVYHKDLKLTDEMSGEMVDLAVQIFRKMHSGH